MSREGRETVNWGMASPSTGPPLLVQSKWGSEPMASAIDPTFPQDGVPASKSAMRANWTAAKTEMEALQAGLPVVLLSGADHGVWIDLNSTAEQTLTIPHGQGVVPAERQVFFDLVADAGLDLSAVCVEYVNYLAAQSTATDMVFAVKLQTGSGTSGQQGEFRVVLMPAA